MKKILFILLLIPYGLLLSQVKELKEATNLFEDEKIDEALTKINEAENIYKNTKLGEVEDKTVSNIYLLKIQIAHKKSDTKEIITYLKKLLDYENGTNYLAENISTGDEDFFLTKNELDDAIKNATHEDPEEEPRKKYNTKKALEIANDLAISSNNKGIEYYNSNKFSEAAQEFKYTYEVMELIPNLVADTNLIYNAAFSLYSDKKYLESIDTYMWLIENNFTNIRDVYEATDVATGEKTTFQSKAQMDLYVKANSHKDPKHYVSESILPSIYKNTISICMEIKDYKRGEEIALRARDKFPTDKDMLLYIGELYYKQDRKEEFITILEEAVKQDPKNKALYLNLGIVLQELGQKEKARFYYEKAIEIDPNYGDAYFNLAVIILSDEKSINEELSKLGYSSKDQKKAKKLEDQKNKMYKESIVLLEKAIENNKEETIDIVITMKNIYYKLGDMDKMKAMKAKEDKLK